MRDDDERNETSFMEKVKKILIAIGLIAVIGIIVIATLKISSIFNGDTPDLEVKHHTDIDVTVIEGKLVACADLVTTKYEYTDVAEVEDYKQIKGKNIPLTGHKIKVSYKGTILAGVDMSKINSKVSILGDKIVIELPEVKIISNAIDQDSIKTIEDNNVFNPIKSDELSKLLAEQEKEQLEIAKEQGLYEQAEKEAKDVIEEQLSVYEGYTVEFK